GIWSTPINLTSLDNSTAPDVGIFQNEAAVIWSKSSCPQGAVIQATSLDLTDDTIAPVTTLFNLANPADEPVLAINSAGDIVTAWRGVSGADNLIWSAGGTFVGPDICIDPNTNSGPTTG